MADGKAPPKKSDLGVRTASAVVMLVVAGGALLAGGWLWTAFVAILAVVAAWEWQRLVSLFAESGPLRRALWSGGGLVYIGLATYTLWTLRLADNPIDPDHRGIGAGRRFLRKLDEAARGTQGFKQPHSGTWRRT
jgi:GNAT superfamily N-acetyltransferase